MYALNTMHVVIALGKMRTVNLTCNLLYYMQIHSLHFTGGL